MLSATLLMQAVPQTLYAQTKEIKVLTLEKAIQKAQDTSVTLRMQERNTELAKENADMSKLMYGYYAYDAAKINYMHMEKQQEVMKDNIALSVTQIFDTIRMSEAQLRNLGNNIALQEKQLQKAKIQQQKGIQSELYIEESELRLQQSKQQQTKLEQDIDSLYGQLCDMLGTSKQTYILEKPEEVFTPYRDYASIEGFAASKAKEHIDLWKATEELRVAEDTPIFTSDYMQYITKKAERENKKDMVELTEDQLRQKIKDIYVRVKKLEADYAMKEKDLALQEKQLQVNKVYLEKGMLSQLDYDMSVLKYETGLLELEQLANEHSYLTFKLDHPHLI